MSTATPLQNTAAKPSSASKSPHAGLLLQRKCACGGSASSSLAGECEECKKKRLQKKLNIGASNDPLEQEADRVAEQVLSVPAHSAVSATPPRIQRFTGQATSDAGTAPASVDRMLFGSGRPLDLALQQDMGQRFGHDFSKVRVHTGTDAEQSAQDANAHAYTVGNNVVFGAGQFAPESHAGRKLLAHELTHVVQQSLIAPRMVTRKPTKSGIKKLEYGYSTNCGWIDWGHANPGFAKNLIASVQRASDDLNGAGYGGPTASPTMAAKKFGVVFSSTSMEVTLARPLSPDEVLAVSLSLFKNLSIVFEIQQEWTDWFSGSSFSQEDLPSNLISFYRAARGFTKDQIEQYCGSQGVDASLKEYDKNSDFQKNHTFSPIGASGSWPAQLSTIDETKGTPLYRVTSVSVGAPASSLKLCPLYRVVGTIGETDLFIVSVGGATFTPADDVRVVPTYSNIDTDRVSGLYGHVPFVEVKPYSPSDEGKLKAKKIKTPLIVPMPVLVCVGDIEGGDMTRHL